MKANKQAAKAKSLSQEQQRKDAKQPASRASELKDASIGKSAIQQDDGYLRSSLHSSSIQDCECCSLLNTVGGFEFPSENMIISDGDGIQLALTRAYLPKIEDYRDLETRLGELTDWYDDDNSLYFALGVERKGNTRKYYFVLGFGENFAIGNNLYLRGDRIALTDASVYDYTLCEGNDDDTPRYKLRLASTQELFALRLGALAVAYIAMICAQWHSRYKLGDDPRITLRHITSSSLELCNDVKKPGIYFDAGNRWVTGSCASLFMDSDNVSEARHLMQVLAKIVSGTEGAPR